MDRAVVEQLLDEMISSLEELETKAAATLQFLKDKGHATEKDLAPYLEQAGNASNVRWRAARLRMMSLLSSALKSVEEPKEKAEAEAAKAAAPAEPTSAQPAAKPESASEEVPAELAQATKAQSSGAKQSDDVGETPKPDSPEYKNAEHPHSAAEAKLPPNQAQPEESTTKSAPSPENSDLTRTADRPAQRKTKEDAA